MTKALVRDIEDSVFEIGKYLIEEMVAGMASSYKDGVLVLLSLNKPMQEMTQEWVIAVKKMEFNDVVKGSLLDIHIGGAVRTFVTLELFSLEMISL